MLLLLGKSAATEWYTLRGMLSTRHTPVVRTDCRTAATQARQQRQVGFDQRVLMSCSTFYQATARAGWGRPHFIVRLFDV